MNITTSLIESAKSHAHKHIESDGYCSGTASIDIHSGTLACYVVFRTNNYGKRPNWHISFTLDGKTISKANVVKLLTNETTA